MVRIGDTLYGMRIVNTYRGQLYEKPPLFNGFVGIIVWDTWDTGDWQILRGYLENGTYRTEEIGIIDESKIQNNWSSEQFADFIKTEAIKAATPFSPCEISKAQVKQDLLTFATVTPRNFAGKHHISKKAFEELVDNITEYVNNHIQKACELSQNYSIAVDEIIAQIIQIRDDRPM